VWLDNDRDQERVLDTVRAENIGLVILDPLRSLTACVDQGPRELQPLTRFLRRLIDETGAGVLALHHLQKQVLTRGKDDRRPMQRVSGGGLVSIAEAPIAVTAEGTDVMRVAPDGTKHAIDIAPFRLRRMQFGDGLVCLQEQVEPLTTKEVAPTVSATSMEIAEVLANVPHVAGPDASGRAIAEATGLPRKVVTVALDALKRDGKVTVTAGPRRSQWWTRTSGDSQ
jgi:hypothetical protein